MRDMRGTSERDYRRLPWGQVHLRTAGPADGKPLVLLHQSPLSSATFEPILPLLADAGYRVVAPDTPGFGMSDPTPRPWSIPEYAVGVWALLDEIGLDEVTILGQHTGAVIAAEAAVQQPDRTRGLVFQGLPIYTLEEREEKKRSYAPGYQPDLSGRHLRTIWERVRGLYPASDVDECDRQVLEYLATGPDYATAYRAVFEYELRPKALDEVPIALVHGKDDLVHRFTDSVTEAFPHARLCLTEGSDFAPAEHPQEYVNALVRQLRTFDAQDVTA